MFKKIMCSLSLAITTLCFLGPLQAIEAKSDNQHQDYTFDQSKWEIQHDLFILHVIPKCGTHYIERIIQLMTHQHIVNQNINIPLLSKLCANNTILRTFQTFQEVRLTILKNYDHKVIAMIRDPRDALISHVFYMRNYVTKPGTDPFKRDFFRVGENFDSLSLHDQITSLILGENGCMSYLDFYKERIGWALAKGNLCVKYEDLLGKEGGGSDAIQKATILKIANFIHVHLNEKQLQHVLDEMYVDLGARDLGDGRVFERSTSGNWKKFLTKQQISLIKKKLGEEIIQLGYEKNYNW